MCLVADGRPIRNTTNTTMNFRTKVELPVGSFSITHRNSIMLAGSCFAGNIGAMLARRKFNIGANPFGILYNPLSIASMLTRVISGEPFTPASPEITEHNGKWHSMMHHGDFSRNSLEELLDALNDSMTESHARAMSCDTVIITFGTAYVYERTSDGMVVGNCHKLPASTFTRRLLGIDEIVSAMSAVMERYIAATPGIRFIFTVSPIRHLRDGAHDNQMSKATLLLAIERLRALYPGNTFYFPAYEILLDELRDYRFYADDMTHPSAMAVEYIWECFGRCCFDETTQKLCDETEAVMRAMEHRPFDETSEGHRRFLRNLVQKMEAIEEKYPHIDFENEKRQCNTLLDR